MSGEARTLREWDEHCRASVRDSFEKLGVALRFGCNDIALREANLLVENLGMLDLLSGMELD